MQAKLSTKRMKHSPTQGSQTRERGAGRQRDGSEWQSHVQQTIECEKSRISFSLPLPLFHSAASSFVQATENKVYDFDCRRRRRRTPPLPMLTTTTTTSIIVDFALLLFCCWSNRTKLNDPVELPFTTTRNHSQRSALPEFI